jgi:hypothetical protein
MELYTLIINESIKLPLVNLHLLLLLLLLLLLNISEKQLLYYTPL